jgi:tagatose-6-phosphate ketose/aldose isomerase
MSHFGMHVHDMERQGAKWTAHEIAQQPEVWAKIQSLVASLHPALNHFLAPLFAQPGLRIILTGAGTSAFIGQCLAPALLQKLQRRVEAIATTDLVSSPDTTLQVSVPTLLVSFARSGNSPESMAAIDLSDQMLRQCSHLVFTCNRDGALYQRMHLRSDSHVFLLPEETNDRAFAMTSSFSGMLLAAMQVFNLIDCTAPKTATISVAATKFMSHSEPCPIPPAPLIAWCIWAVMGLKGWRRKRHLNCSS